MPISTVWVQVYGHVYSPPYLGAADALVPFCLDLGQLTEGWDKYDQHPLQMFVQLYCRTVLLTVILLTRHTWS